MAQPSSTVQFICRSCRQHLSKPSSIRQFSTTTSKSRTIPTFRPSPSPEFDAILADWRKRVFTPAALSSHHQNLIYRKKHRHLLENETGISVTMSNQEEVKLESTNRFDKPIKQDSLFKIAKILGESSNADIWENIPGFLEGLHMAGERVPVPWLEKITRKANEKGKAGIIRRCAEMVRQTNVKLALQPVTRELMLGIHNRAAEQGFQGNGISSLCAEAEHLARLMDKEEHCGGKLRGQEIDMRQDLTVLGVLLELAASKAILTHDSKDMEGTVSDYATKLLAIAGNNILKRTTSTKNNEYIIAEDAQLLEPGTEAACIEDWIPISNALRLASRVKGTSLTKDQQSVMRLELNKIDSMIQKTAEIVRRDAGGKPRRALKMLDTLEGVKSKATVV